MNPFTVAENKGRKLFRSILDQEGIDDQHPSEDQFDTIDYYYTNKQGEVVGVEIKKRDQQYSNYPTHYMEWNKLTSICNKIKQKEIDKALYVNFFGEDLAYIYRITDIIQALKDKKAQLITKNLKRTSAIYQGYIPKKVVEIPTEIGLKISRINNKWIKQQ